jgi:hypothetical protein
MSYETDCGIKVGDIVTAIIETAKDGWTTLTINDRKEVYVLILNGQIRL